MGKLRLRKFNSLTKTTQVVKERVGTRTSVCSFLLWPFHLTDSWRWSARGMVLCWFSYVTREGMQRGSDGKESACSAADPGLIPRSGRSPGESGGGVRWAVSSIVAWRIPWTKEPGGLQSMGSQRVRHGWGTNTFTCRWYQSNGRKWREASWWGWNRRVKTLS